MLTMDYSIIDIREWASFVVECLILLVVWMEYKYDKDKDEAKKHRKTKTTKKTTNSKDGVSVVEESTEISEPIEEEQNEQRPR